MVFIAHIRVSDKEIQTVSEHLTGVQTLAELIGSKMQISHITGLAGLLHDLGKFTQEFREYILQAVENPDNPPVRGSVDHATAGGRLLFRLFHSSKDKFKVLLAEIVGNAIISHHSYLHDFINPDLESKFLNRIEKPDLYGYDEAVTHFFKEVMSEEELHQYAERALEELEGYLVKEPKVSTEHKCMLLSKYVFSALIDADRTNTRLFEEKKDLDETIDTQLLFKDFEQKLLSEIEEFSSFPDADSPINLLRQEMSQQCAQYAYKSPGIFTLSIPTGGGKTLASLRYALRHALEHGMERIIYIVPFTTIIEQNASEVRRILQTEEHILEHHSNVVERENDDDELEDGFANVRQKLRLARDDWNAPIIFTTMVQFLNAFYADGNRNTRRLHRMSRSVLIFDEVQKVPISCISLFNQAVNFLKNRAGSTIVLCTATQPELSYVRHKLELQPESEMIQQLAKVTTAFRRVEPVDLATTQPFYNDTLADFIAEKMKEVRSILIILNTKSVVKALYRTLIENEAMSGIPVYHLSTSMCAAHRKDILEQVKTHLKRKEPVICISTQLIEAGVNVSFQCVIRSLAGLDSLAQAAGRCNRHGEDPERQVYLIDHADEKLDHLKEIIKGKEIAKNLLLDLKRDPKVLGGHILSHEAMKVYFQQFYKAFEPELDYRIRKLDKNMTDLLSASRGKMRKETYFWSYYEENKKFLPLALSNSYKTAAEHFRVIDDRTTTVIVPYEEGGKEIIADLNGQQSIGGLSLLMRKAQQYTVQLYSHELKLLERDGSLVAYLDGKILALKEAAYSKDFGLNVDSDSEMASAIF